MGEYGRKEQIKDAIGLMAMVPLFYVVTVLMLSL